MQVSAKLNNLKISPRKVRLVVDVIRGMKVEKALDQLKFINKKSTHPIDKLLKSAIANAENNFELKIDNLLVKEIRVDEGMTMKRSMPRARGRATVIRKRVSHVMITLGELVDSGEKKGKQTKIEAPIKLTGNVKEEGAAKVKPKAEEKIAKEDADEKGKKIVDPRMEGHGKHSKIEKDSKGFVNKMFRRKSG
jgi:large subunit ribosomal protein L22